MKETKATITNVEEKLFFFLFLLDFEGEKIWFPLHRQNCQQSALYIKKQTKQTPKECEIGSEFFNKKNNNNKKKGSSLPTKKKKRVSATFGNLVDAFMQQLRFLASHEIMRPWRNGYRKIARNVRYRVQSQLPQIWERNQFRTRTIFKKLIFYQTNTV